MNSQWHWREKRAIIRSVLNLSTFREIADEVYPSAADASLRHDAKVAMRQWTKSRPTKYRKFFNRLVELLKCSQGVTGQDIVECSVAEFVGFLPEGSRGRALRALAQLTPVEIAASADAAEPTDRSREGEQQSHQHRRLFESHHSGEHESLVAGVLGGSLDTRHYYSTFDAARAWHDLTAADTYESYDRCKDSLRALTELAEWRVATQATSIANVVMLAGGGSPTKDMLLAKALLSERARSSEAMHMSIVDINWPMLDQSSRVLERAMKTSALRGRLELSYIVRDVLALGGPPPVFPRRGRALFAILGGTIGNVREAAFFRSVNRISHPADLLIVSADTIDASNVEAQLADLERSYDSAEMRAFVTPGVRAALDTYGLEESVRSALQRVAVIIDQSASPRLSDVPKSWSATLRLVVKGHEVLLLSSARYDAHEFVEFVRRFGWEHICTAIGPTDRAFAQFLFRRSRGRERG